MNPAESRSRIAVRMAAAVLAGVCVALGTYFLAAELGAGRTLAGGIGGGVGGYCGSVLLRLAERGDRG